MPLVVLSRGLPDESNNVDEGTHSRHQAEFVLLSSKGRQVIAKHSRHHICIDEPDLEASVIYHLLEMTKVSDNP
jgi:hypothetical protein